MSLAGSSLLDHFHKVYAGMHDFGPVPRAAALEKMLPVLGILLSTEYRQRQFFVHPQREPRLAADTIS
ncbi:MAG: hypothetical protein OXF33_00775 [Rhodospirillales bacterium]|nr:hypothetical protein [Rhodospirillales bacterium]